MASRSKPDAWQTVKPHKVGKVVDHVAKEVPLVQPSFAPPAQEKQPSGELDSRTGDASSSTAVNGVIQNVAPPKPKVKKVKKVKVSLGSAASALRPEDLKKFLELLKDKYKQEETPQLERLADYFSKIFDEVELPFNKLLADQPLQKVRRPYLKAGQPSDVGLTGCFVFACMLRKSHACLAKTTAVGMQVTDIPVEAIPAEIRGIVAEFLAGKSVASLSSLVGLLINAVFEGVPESVNSKQPLPKAKVPTPAGLSAVPLSFHSAYTAILRSGAVWALAFPEHCLECPEARVMSAGHKGEPGVAFAC
jgi:hypothetical protein